MRAPGGRLRARGASGVRGEPRSLRRVPLPDAAPLLPPGSFSRPAPLLGTKCLHTRVKSVNAVRLLGKQRLSQAFGDPVVSR